MRLLEGVSVKSGVLREQQVLTFCFLRSGGGSGDEGYASVSKASAARRLGQNNQGNEEAAIPTYATVDLSKKVWLHTMSMISSKLINCVKVDI